MRGRHRAVAATIGQLTAATAPPITAPVANPFKKLSPLINAVTPPVPPPAIAPFPTVPQKPPH